ncbi:MAG: phosphoribosyl-ATP diphosphatase [Desulfuromonadaceae bacterium]|nr:phosphoribosyl-ATP diphosphatase [Desulfuromonadaceae bacterium]
MSETQEQLRPGEEILNHLYAVIQERKSHPSLDSHVSSLFAKGLDKILTKIGEEATETVIAGKGGKREEIVHESADLLFHLVVLLGFYNISPDAVFGELRRRFGISGLEEKRRRNPVGKDES